MLFRVDQKVWGGWELSDLEAIFSQIRGPNPVSCILSLLLLKSVRNNTHVRLSFWVSNSPEPEVESNPLGTLTVWSTEADVVNGRPGNVLKSSQFIPNSHLLEY